MVKSLSGKIVREDDVLDAHLLLKFIANFQTVI